MLDATAGMDEMTNAALKAIWEHGWSDNSLLAIKLNISDSTVKRAKHEIVERVAVRWGMWP